MKITGWAAFWMFMIVFFIGDSIMYWKGHDTFFYSYRAAAELEHQRNQLGLTNNKPRREL